jgi:hypothetical protein
MSFTLLGSPCSVRVQVRFWVRRSGFGVRRTEREHERRSEKLRSVNDTGADDTGAGLL